MFALTLNQLANNSHKRESDPSNYFTLYNGNKIASIRVRSSLPSVSPGPATVAATVCHHDG